MRTTLFGRWRATAPALALFGLAAVGSAHAQPGDPAQPAPPVPAQPTPPIPAQPSDPAAPAPAPVPAPLPPVDPQPVPEPYPVPAEAPYAEPAPTMETMEEESGELAAPEVATLRVHIITTDNRYEDMDFDIFSVETRELVASATGALEGKGEEAPTFELSPGIYKIVKAGEPYASRSDFATVTVLDSVDYVIVVDPTTHEFRGAGIVTDGLPDGIEIGGIKLGLNVGGTLWVNQQKNIVGATNGTSSLLGLFGNFSLVFDRDSHHLAVDSNLQLNLRDTETGSAASTTDYFEGSALYSYNIANPYVGPYARGGFKTRVFPGYLYLQDDAATGQVQVNRLDGTTDNYTFGSEANPDDLRIEVAQPLAPLILQEELGANLKAVDLDLRLVELAVATRLGWAFRQGFTNELLVVQGEERGTPVVLDEVDDYYTNGPLVGADASVTFARWLFGQANFGMLVPIQNKDRAGDNFGERLLIDLSGSGGFKVPILNDFLYAGADYTFRLRRDGYLTSDTMFEHALMARASLQIF